MFDFCGIGNACVDIIANVDDAFLRTWNYPKSICTYISLEEANRLEAALPSPAYIPGGCGANTAACIGALGGRAAFMGRIANDAIGAVFLGDVKLRGIHYTGMPDMREGIGSTRIFALITPDTERTFAAYYGVQETLGVDDLDPEAISASRFMYLDGYALNSPHAGEAFLQAAVIAKKAGQSVVFSPSDLSILKIHAEIVGKIIRAADFIVCNAQEALYLSGKDSLPDASESLRGMISNGAVTAGEDGVYVFDDKGVYHVPAAVPPGPVIDTNGAGDHFAGGFLYGLSRGYDMERAARLGNRCAATIITKVGARLTGDYSHLVAETV